MTASQHDKTNDKFRQGVQGTGEWIVLLEIEKLERMEIVGILATHIWDTKAKANSTVGRH